MTITKRTQKYFWRFLSQIVLSGYFFALLVFCLFIASDFVCLWVFFLCVYVSHSFCLFFFFKFNFYSFFFFLFSKERERERVGLGQWGGSGEDEGEETVITIYCMKKTYFQ